MRKKDGRERVVICRVEPEIDAGRYPIKRVEGDTVRVTADIFADGHDVVTAALLVRRTGKRAWFRIPMNHLGNDGWEAEFTVPEVGEYRYTLEGRVDYFLSWRRDFRKRVEAGQDVGVDLQIGAKLVFAAAARAKGKVRKSLEGAAAVLTGDGDSAERTAFALGEALLALMGSCPDRSRVTRYSRELSVQADRRRAQFSAWYEVFPRSTSPVPGRHGTFGDLAKRLEYIADLGFDIVYLPPIHPIGRTHRKGKNNDPVGKPGDVGSPWAIGAEEGGHKAVHPDLGTLEDFRAVVARAETLGMEIALDIAFQCSPDHPYAKEHPEWFRKRPDGTIQYAENPPKKYEDIHPFDFECDDWEALWEELHSVVRFWADEGVRVFRVDNPHTKTFCFWEWLIARIRAEYPESIFLAEAFTRPKVMYQLAKLGFDQSYTYFTWRDTSREFREYLTELTTTEPREYFRPNFWPNTPDILPEHLQKGTPATFASRLVLAATLSSNYGMYGPAFEQMERTPREPGSEEYLDSEKYEIRQRDLDRSPNLRDLISRVNRIRNENPALQQTGNLHFHECRNDKLLCYSKSSGDGGNIVLVVVNMETGFTHQGFVELDLGVLGLDAETPFQAHDLLDGSSYTWRGSRNFVELDPAKKAAHIFLIRPGETTGRSVEGDCG